MGGFAAADGEADTAGPHQTRFLRFLKGVSLDIENYCTASLFFEQAYLSQWGVLPRYTLFSIDFV
ncbi:hypothetical protein HX37_25270 [Salmonella enterica]|uniref:Uncharacterized protein n=1 Tax=Salmonella enterica TaxID=28901 RepID=A0A5U2FAM7_SALER|nr:hypothetical protein [Salmonella enterica]